MTEKLLTYALGRGLESHDIPVVRSIVKDASRSDYRFQSIVLGIVNSTPFRMRVKPNEAIGEAKQPTAQTTAQVARAR
jgi:hypothetical protein